MLQNIQQGIKYTDYLDMNTGTFYKQAKPT